MAEISVSQWCHEETLINYVFNDKIEFLDRRFNYCHSRQYQNSMPESEASILHYVGGRRYKKQMYENPVLNKIIRVKKPYKNSVGKFVYYLREKFFNAPI